MSLFRQHFLAILICCTVIVCFLVYAVSHRYVHAGGGWVLDKWTGKVEQGWQK